MLAALGVLWTLTDAIHAGEGTLSLNCVYTYIYVRVCVCVCVFVSLCVGVSQRIWFFPVSDIIGY